MGFLTLIPASSFILLWTSSHVAASAKCPESVPQDKYTQVFEGHCYRFEMGEIRYFWDAEEYCKEHYRGAHLVSIPSKQVNDFLTKKLIDTYSYKHAVWIGLNDVRHEGKLAWTDGTPLGSYIRIANGNHGDKDCFYLAPGENGEWRNQECRIYEKPWYLNIFFETIRHNKKPFICQIPGVVNTTTTTTTNTTTTTTTPVPTTTVSTAPVPTKPGCPVLSCSGGCSVDGYGRDENNCPTCECAGPGTGSNNCPTLECTNGCGMEGYLLDENGCTTCDCSPPEGPRTSKASPTRQSVATTVQPHTPTSDSWTSKTLPTGESDNSTVPPLTNVSDPYYF